ncbi:MAG: polysaccharide deacetylase family protein [Polyangiaceae bacterium]
MPSAFVRARSRVVRAVASEILPRSVFMAHGARRSHPKRIALTFDDGPDAMTPAYLETLGALGVCATFFLIGEQALRSPEIVREYVRRGHDVGGHGWTHSPFSPMSPARLADELDRTAAVLPPCRGRRPAVRPPRGVLSLPSLMRVARMGYLTVLWSVDSDDCRTRDPAVVARRLAPSEVRSGDVVLLHEMQPWTLKALPSAVSALRRAGYEFVTIRELRGGRGGA